MVNPLQRGVDPYADAETTRKLAAPRTSVDMDATKYAAGTSVYMIAPIDGQVRKLKAVVGILTAGAGLLTLKQGTDTLGTLVIPDASAVGTVVMADIADSVTNSAVKENAALEIESDGTPTAGAVEITVEFDMGAV